MKETVSIQVKDILINGNGGSMDSLHVGEASFSVTVEAEKDVAINTTNVLLELVKTVLAAVKEGTLKI